MLEKGLSEARSLPSARSAPSPATRAVCVFEASFLLLWRSERPERSERSDRKLLLEVVEVQVTSSRSLGKTSVALPVQDLGKT